METIYDRISARRKKLQAEGLVPEWYTTAALQMFEEKYEYDTNGRSVKGQFERIAKTAAKHVEKEFPQAEEKFVQLLWNGWLSPSTPVLANTGTDRGMPVSCSGGVVGDSIDSFYQSQHELAMLTKYGFGTSSDLSNIRPRGSKISVGGKASGVLPVYKMYVETMRNVAQGTSRRGAWAGYLDIEHGDFDELWNAVNDDPDDSNIGWIIKDSFIEKLNAGDAEATRRYQKALKLKMVQGKGYFCFVDKINAKRPAAYVNNNLTVKASNLCVAPETLVLTSKGHLPIYTLENQKVLVWNGREFSETVVRKTGENKRLVKVVTDSMPILECTPEHVFYVSNFYGKPAIKVAAENLRVGDKLIKFDLPVIEGSEELSFAYDNGIFSAEGCDITANKKRIYLYHEKRKLREFITCNGKWSVQENQNREHIDTIDLCDKFFVPDTRYSIQSRLRWFEGLCDGDGTIARNLNNESLQLCNINKKFLKDVQLMLQTLGVSSKVCFSVEEGERLLPANDGTGDLKLFSCKDSYRLLVSSNGLYKLICIGFSPKRLQVTLRKPQREAEKFTKVLSVENTERISDTYCFTESIRNMGVFNGILTGNCDEITLHSDSEHVYTCVLSSMNVYKWNEWKDTDAVFWATVFLDCVAEEFIQKGSGIPGLEKAIRSTIKGRALGLGQCGWHSLLQKERFTFGGFDAQMLSMDIAKHIYLESKKASELLAKKYGEPEWCKGTGLRNSHRIAIAPTKSTALLMGGISEGINPDPGMVYTQNTAAGVVDRIVPEFLKLMKERGHYSRKTLDSIISKQGSVQHLDWLTEEEKSVFRTAFEINQKDVIRQAATRGKYLDQWQSLNLFFAAEEDESWISEVHQEAFENKDILGLYYIYTQAGVTGAKGECEACQ
mgnify:CR=1 FL=1